MTEPYRFFPVGNSLVELLGEKPREPARRYAPRNVSTFQGIGDGIDALDEQIRNLEGHIDEAFGVQQRKIEWFDTSLKAMATFNRRTIWFVVVVCMLVMVVNAAVVMELR